MRSPHAHVQGHILLTKSCSMEFYVPKGFILLTKSFDHPWGASLNHTEVVYEPGKS